MYSFSYGSFLRFFFGAADGRAGPNPSSSEEESAPVSLGSRPVMGSQYFTFINSWRTSVIVL